MGRFAIGQHWETTKEMSVETVWEGLKGIRKRDRLNFERIEGAQNYWKEIRCPSPEWSALILRHLWDDSPDDRIVLFEGLTYRAFRWSGRQDLNLRHLGPKPSALPG